MKQFNATTLKRSTFRAFMSLILLGIISIAKGQCPPGSLTYTGPAPATYTNGQTVCINSIVAAGDITLNNGATMIITSLGSFTGNLTARQGSTITVQAGGNLSPILNNQFGATFTNNGTTTIVSVNLTNGVSITNNGTMTWWVWTQSTALTVTNTPCGVMTFVTAPNINVSGTTINNKGLLNANNDFTLGSGSTVINEGYLNFNGTLSTSGRIENRWKMVASSNVNLNTGDSLINFYQMTFTNPITCNGNIRNEGLLWLKGSFTLNGSRTIQMNFSDAELRIDGALANNGTITGRDLLYVGGAISNNSGAIIQGFNASGLLTVNKSIPGPGTSPNTVVNAGLTVYDTTTYTNNRRTFTSCAAYLPITLSPLQGVYKNNKTVLNWYSVFESNTKTFHIEYSKNGIDFTTVGTIPASGNSNNRIDYTYTHNTTATGTLFYRLREEDIDGKITYSTIAIVKSTSNAQIAVNILPNPFSDRINCLVEVTRPTTVNISLVGSNGSVIQRLTRQVQAGNNVITINNLGGLSSGVYMLQVNTGDQTFVQKLVK